MGSVSFCESVTATSISPWCIRDLTTRGRLPGGGVDTASLCGRVSVGWGWDLPRPEVAPNIDGRHVCPKCRVIYLERARS